MTSCKDQCCQLLKPNNIIKVAKEKIGRVENTVKNAIT